MKSLSQKPISRNSAAGRCRWALTLLLPFLSLPAFGQNATNPPDPPGRFLLLVDTSSSMRRRAEGVLQTVESLLNSDLGGRLRPGDTIGLWTFNEDVYTGRFPLQQWSPATRRAVTANVLEFLKRQRYEKKSKLDKALTRAFSLVRESPAITLFLLTDGKASVRGTPFDAAIDTVFQKYGSEQARVRLPFVTVLRAEGGSFVNGNVGLPPWRIDVPATPGESARASKSTKPEKPPPPKTVAPKPAPAELRFGRPKPAETQAVKPPETPAEQPKPEPTPPANPPPTTEVKPVEVKVAQPQTPDVATTTPPQASPAPSSAPASAPATAPSLGATSTPVPPTQAGQVLEAAKPSPPPVEPAKSPAVETPLLVAPAVAPPKTPAPAVPAENKQVEDVKPAPVVATESKPAPVEPLLKPEVKSPPVSEPASAKTSPAEPKAEPTSPLPPPLAEAKPVMPENAGAGSLKTAPPTAPLPVQEGLVSPQPFLSGPRLLLLGLLLLAVAGMLFWFIVRRSHVVAASGSLISQSFERDKKEP